MKLNAFFIALLCVFFFLLFKSCTVEEKNIVRVNFSFQNALFYKQIPETNNFQFIDSLGAGICSFTLDSVFVFIPKNQIAFGYKKIYVEVAKDGHKKFSLFHGDEFAELYLSPQYQDIFNAELYIKDFMIEFNPFFEVISVE